MMPVLNVAVSVIAICAAAGCAMDTDRSGSDSPDSVGRARILDWVTIESGQPKSVAELLEGPDADAHRESGGTPNTTVAAVALGGHAGLDLLRETGATLTLYSEAGLPDEGLTVVVPPRTAAESVRLIANAEICAANLLGPVDSLRLTCGSRASNVVVFEAQNTGESLASWSELGQSFSISCVPHQTVTVKLHETTEFAGSVGSLYFVSHARKAQASPFSSGLAAFWSGLVEALSHSLAVGLPELKLTGETRFILRQEMMRRHESVAVESGDLVLDAKLNDDLTVTVDVVEAPGGCHELRPNPFCDEMADAAVALKKELENLAARAAEHPRRYFVPTSGLSEFDLMGGGEPASAVP